MKLKLNLKIQGGVGGRVIPKIYPWGMYGYFYFWNHSFSLQLYYMTDSLFLDYAHSTERVKILNKINIFALFAGHLSMLGDDSSSSSCKNCGSWSLWC